MSKKVLIATSGTGGHVFPALYLAKELKSQGHRVMMCGTFHKFAHHVAAENIDYTLINMQGFVSLKWWQFPIAVIKLFAGYVFARKVIWDFKPHATVGFGGYSSFPVVLASKIAGCPVVIHEQNVIPGKANRYLSGFVDKIAVSFELSKRYFQKDYKTIKTGCPCLLPESRDRIVELAKLGFSQDRKTILIVGGSQGSQRINQECLGIFSEINEDKFIQVYHMTGYSDFENMKKSYEGVSFPYIVVPFINNMAQAYTVADVLIARSGAVTVAEVAQWKIPTIFIPYPYALNHQLANAKVLYDEGKAHIIEEKELTKERLKGVLKNVINDKMTRSLDSKESVVTPQQRLARLVIGTIHD